MEQPPRNTISPSTARAPPARACARSRGMLGLWTHRQGGTNSSPRSCSAERASKSPAARRSSALVRRQPASAVGVAADEILSEPRPAGLLHASSATSARATSASASCSSICRRLIRVLHVANARADVDAVYDRIDEGDAWRRQRLRPQPPRQPAEFLLRRGLRRPNSASTRQSEHGPSGVRDARPLAPSARGSASAALDHAEVAPRSARRCAVGLQAARRVRRSSSVRRSACARTRTVGGRVRASDARSRCAQDAAKAGYLAYARPRQRARHRFPRSGRRRR